MNTTVLIIAAAVLAVLNLISFGLMAYDKRCAKAGKWRVPEKTLFVTAAIGGSIGAIAGMLVFRHKTKHWYFVYGMPGILLLQILIAWIAVRGI